MNVAVMVKVPAGGKALHPGGAVHAKEVMVVG
jgi:hypothetical protein